jgi:hypothetical protein
MLSWLPRSAQMLRPNDINPSFSRFDLEPFNRMLLPTYDFGQGTVQQEDCTASPPDRRQSGRKIGVLFPARTEPCPTVSFRRGYVRAGFGSFLLHEQKKRRQKADRILCSTPHADRVSTRSYDSGFRGCSKKFIQVVPAPSRPAYPEHCSSKRM